MDRAIAIGTSHGGVDALRIFVSGLPKDFDQPVFVVLHVGSAPSMLPSLLSAAGPLVATHACDGEEIRKGHIYVAPPDHHMLVEGRHIRLSRGPRENWARPAIDPLFRSVAKTFDGNAIGIILTGNLNDGTAGLYEIRNRGGVAIIQDPGEAEAPSMPQSAVENVGADFVVQVSEMPALVARLTKKAEKNPDEPAGGPLMPNHEWDFKQPVAQTCPECGGAMRTEGLGNLTQYRCHIGHVMTAEVLAQAQRQTLGDRIASCIRAAREHSELCREIAAKYESRGGHGPAVQWRKAADQSDERARILAGLEENGWIRPTSGLAADQKEISEFAE
ncbi:MAG TPA: chemotaxis protein CheB [Rhizomicrobium sp.]|jgi:two-component system chemotaxis response regulator CheB|nr:chemotaxis protein CheB [Rhizomicrobium sp.]